MSSSHVGRPSACYIDHDSLRWNFRQIRSLLGAQVRILSMVKANGYGHGAPTVARTLAAEGSDAFGVAIIEEAIVRQILPKLKAAKAQGIVEYPLNKIVL